MPELIRFSTKGTTTVMMDFLFPNIASVNMTVGGILTCLAIALVLGLLLSAVYIFSRRSKGYISTFPAAMVMLAPLMAGVTIIINSNVATAISLGGALALLRIRSYPKDTADIVSLLFSLIIGIGCGTGYYGVTIILTVALCAVMAVLGVTRFGVPGNNHLLLKITVPEDLNFDGAFDGVLDKYTDEYTLKEIRTTDFGALYELRYNVILPKDCDRREFIDEIRTRNGNLDVILVLQEFDNPKR